MEGSLTFCLHITLSIQYAAVLFNTITIDNQQDATILIYLLLIRSACFGRRLRPSSEAYYCNYRFWYCPPIYYN